MNYYNEHDPKAAHWLRCLIDAGLIPKGDVDERSIAEVQPSDLRGYLQVHLFAGIGGWSHALALAGWPEDAPVWTGSCPCQPFSAAGKRRGTDDERHLWPEMHRLVQECQPATVFGEQVSGNDGLKWFAGVRADLEASGYAVGCADLPAACVGAPHRRQRLFWVADAESSGPRRRNGAYGENGTKAANDSRLGDTDCERRSRRVAKQGQRPYCNADGSGEGFWSDAILIPCGDGKTRRIEPGLEPLVDGLQPVLVTVCASCKTECWINETLCILRTPDGRTVGYEQTQILQPCVHGTGAATKSIDTTEWQATGSTAPCCRSMRAVWGRVATGTPPQRPGRHEQLAGKHPDIMPEMPQGTTPEAAQAIVVCGMPTPVCGQRPQKPAEQDLFCGVCKTVGPHLCDETMGSRVTILRGLGNAIVPQVAAKFIQAYMDTQGNLCNATT